MQERFSHYCRPSSARGMAGHKKRDAFCQHLGPEGGTTCMHFLIYWARLQLPEQANRKDANKSPAIYKENTLNPEWRKTKNPPQTTPQNPNRKGHIWISACFFLLERSICYSLRREQCSHPRWTLTQVILIQNVNICFIHSGLMPWGKRKRSEGAGEEKLPGPSLQCFS